MLLCHYYVYLFCIILVEINLNGETWLLRILAAIELETAGLLLLFVTTVYLNFLNFYFDRLQRTEATLSLGLQIKFFFNQ